MRVIGRIIKQARVTQTSQTSHVSGPAPNRRRQLGPGGESRKPPDARQFFVFYKN